MSYSKYIIKEDLKNYLVSNPSDAPEFLSVVSEALKEFEDNLKKQREGIFSNAVINTMGYVLSSKRITDKRMYDSHLILTSLINSIYISFPDPKRLEHAQIMKDGLGVFVKACEEEDVLNSEDWSLWLENYLGDEKTKWLSEIINNYNETIKHEKVL